MTETDTPPDLAEAFRAMILEKSFPCVGAKSALGRGTLDLLTARSIRSAWDDLAIHEALMRFAWAYKQEPGLFRSFAVLFEEADDLDEAGFEVAMWARLQSLSDKDAWRGQPADPRVSSDPADPHFGLSFGGEAFFVRASRPRFQPARPIRDAARAEPLRATARLNHRARRGAGGQSQPDAVAPRRNVGGAAI